MESSWRRNVPDMGLSDGFATLAARVLTVTPEFWITNHIVAPGVVRAWFPPAVGQDPPQYAPSTAATHGLHFPYGYVVPPDVHT